MRFTSHLAGILLAATLTSALPGHAAVWGSWNFDGTCGGYPEVECSKRIIYLAESWGDADLASCTAAIREARKLPFPSRIALASTKPQLGLAGSENVSLRVPLNLPAGWITSGVWTEDGSLLLVDAGRGDLLRVSGSGLDIVDLGVPALRASDLRATEKGFILKLRDGRFVALDRQGRLTETLGLLTAEAGKAGVQSLVNWVPIGDSVLAFGDILNPDSTWISGWLQMSLHSPASFNLLRSLPVASPARKLYQLGYPYAASIGSTGYFLTMDGGRPRLLTITRVAGGVQQRELFLPADLLPASGFRLESLPTGGEPADIVARYQALEKSFVPVGLYSQGSNLYLLVRRPMETGQTQWELVRLNPESGEVLGRISLPTQANHLLVIPGKELWAVIEKGSVQAPGTQDVQGLLLIPSRWIEDGSGSYRKLKGDSLKAQVGEPGQGQAARRK